MGILNEDDFHPDDHVHIRISMIQPNFFCVMRQQSYNGLPFTDWQSNGLSFKI